MTKQLQDRVALVTGASRGIGYQIAKGLAAEGRTNAVDLHQAALAGAYSTCTSPHGGRVHCLPRALLEGSVGDIEEVGPWRSISLQAARPFVCH